MKKLFLAAVLWLLPLAAWAQTPPTPGLASIILGNASLSVTNASGNVAIPVGSQVVTVLNDGAKELYYAGGGSTVTATTSSIPLPPGACWSMIVQTGAGVDHIAAITGGTDTTTLRVIGSNGGLNASCPGAANVTVSGTISSNLAQVNGATVNVGTGASSTGTQRVAVASDSMIGLVAGSAIVGKVGIDQTTPGTTNGVQVNAALPAGQNGIGNVGGKTVAVCATPTVTASNAYGTNYVVGGLLTFANAFTSTGSGLLQGVVVTINDNETSGFTFFPFNANPSGTTWTDAAVAAIVAGDVAKVRNPVSLNGNNQLKATVFSVYSAAGLGEALAPGTTSLYGVLIANAALTNNFAGTSDIQVCVKVLDDE